MRSSRNWIVSTYPRYVERHLNQRAHHLRRQGFQSHHILPLSFHQHPVIKSSNFDIRSLSNIVFLPTPRIANMCPIRTIHCGRHNRTYDLYWRNHLDEIAEMSLNSADTCREIELRIRSMRDRLMLGAIALNVWSRDDNGYATKR